MMMIGLTSWSSTQCRHQVPLLSLVFSKYQERLQRGEVDGEMQGNARRV